MKQFALILTFLLIPALDLAQTNVWQQTNFPQQSGDDIWELHVSTNGTLFFGIYQYGLMRSTNNAENWEQVHGSEGGAPVLVATTSTGVVFAFVNHEFVRSTDNGTSWTSVGPPQASWVSGIVIDANDHIYVSVFSGVFRSTDLGNSWYAINNGFVDFHPRTLMISPIGFPQALYSFGDSVELGNWSFYRSTNNGGSWALLAFPRQVWGNPLFIHSNGDLFTNSDSGLYRSTNMGNSWQLVNKKTGDQHYQPMLSLPNGDLLGAQNQIDGIIFRSSDGGYHWSGSDTLNCRGIANMLRANDGSIYVGTSQSGLFKAIDEGSTWNQCNTGFPGPISLVAAIAGRPGGTMFAGTMGFGTFVSTNSGQSWVRNFPGEVGSTEIVAHPAGPLFAISVGSDPRLKISYDDGNHWDLSPSFGLWSFNDLAIDASGTIYAFAANTAVGMQRSTDIGATWITTPSPGSGPRMHVTRQGWIVVESFYHDPGYPGDSWFYTRTSTDGGTTWTTASPGNDQVPSYEYGSTGNGYLFAATHLGVYRSIDTGNTWVSINNGLLSNDVRLLASNSVDIVFAGTQAHGVFYSEDYGENWSPMNTGLTDLAIMSLFCDAGGYLFAGTANGGIFKTVGPTTSISHQIDQIPVAFALHQNHPNPFNPSTILQYSIPRDGFVSLIVYDILGREVAVLENSVKQTGTYTISFDASNLSSGVYLYRLQSESNSETKKMVVMK